MQRAAPRLVPAISLLIAKAELGEVPTAAICVANSLPQLVFLEQKHVLANFASDAEVSS